MENRKVPGNWFWAFDITKEEIEESKSFLKEAQIDLAVYDELENHNFPENIKTDVERRKIFLLQQAEEKAVKSMLPHFVRTTAVPLLAMGIWFDEPPAEIKRVIEIYTKRMVRNMEKTFNKKNLKHGLSKTFDTEGMFEDLLILLTTIYQTDKDLLDYIYEGTELVKSKDLERVLKGQDAKKIFGSLEDLKAKILKVQMEGFTPETAAVMTREFLKITTLSISFPVQNIALLNILEQYEQSSRYPDSPRLDKDSLLLKQKAAIRELIGSFVNFSNKTIG